MSYEASAVVGGRPRRGFLLKLGLALLGLGAGAGWAGAQSMPGMRSARRGAEPSGGTFAAQMDAAMDRMDQAMAAAPMTGNPTHDFMSMMIPHHQGAIDMAKLYLIYGRNPHVRNLAEEIIATQANEIQVMRHWLTTLSYGGAAAPRPDATPMDRRHGQ
jgi:hypothetical protein